MATITPIEIQATGLHLLLRSAGIEDAAPLLKLLEDAVAEQQNSVQTLAEFNAQQRDEAAWIHTRRVRNDQIAIVAVARPGTPQVELAGIVFAEAGDFQRTAHTAEVHIVVSKKHRNRGIGRALMNAVIQWGRRHPVISQFLLSVFETNKAAIHLYESLGFQHDGRRRNAIRIEQPDTPPREIDDLLMSLQVREP